MITLYTFGPAFGLPDPSPFVTKAEVLLKMSGLPYRPAICTLRGAPKGKLPYIDDHGRRIADSTLIRFHLEQKYSIDFDRGLSSRERGVAWSVEKLLEDHLYWIMVNGRWLDEKNFLNGPAQFFKPIPGFIRPIIMKKVRSDVSKSLRAHGIGRHTPQEIDTLGERAVNSIAQILGDNDYLMAPTPCGADATAYAFVMGTLCSQFDMGIRRAAESHANLKAYCERMKERFP
jgi:glutathione S-transferase